MYITREVYDQNAFFIRQGALQVWGVQLAKRVDLCRVRELYSLSDFFAELCYDKVTGKPTCICSFTSSNRLLLYAEGVSLGELTGNDNQASD
ncbi:hypothetical protein GCM10028808_63050 [Spirosoma migulaei]